MSSYILNFRLVILLLTCISLNVIIAQEKKSTDEIEALISKISEYQYGNERTPLFEFEQEVIRAINANDNIGDIENLLIEILKAEATLDGKMFACQMLAKIGSKNSIEPLISLLKNSQTSDMARYALEKIHLKEVDDALLKNFDNFNKNTKIGIINTFGARKSEKAVKKLIKIIGNDDEEIAVSAATAIGKIGAVNSIKFIAKLFPKYDGKILSALVDSYLLFGDSYLADGNNKLAKNIYSSVLKKSQEDYQKAAAVRGKLLAAPNDAGNLLLTSLKDHDTYMNQVALANIHLLKSESDHNLIMKNFDEFEEEIQSEVINVIRDHKLIIYLDLIREKCQTAETNIKLRAIDCLHSIGTAEDVELLGKLAISKDYDIRDAARKSLYNIGGGSTDNKISQSLLLVKGKEQEEMIMAIEQRRIKSAKPNLFLTVSDQNSKVRIASYKALTKIGEPEDMDALINVFNGIEEDRELKVFENTLAQVSLKQPDRNKRGDIFLNALDNTKSHEKQMSLIRVLGATGDEKAYKKIKNYLDNDNENIRKVAIQSFYSWPNVDPIHDLIEIIKSTDNQTHKVLALRGYVNLLKEHGASIEDEVVNHYKNVLKYTNEESEKSLIISGLGMVHNAEALKFVSTFLDDEESKSEAEEAAFEIIENAGWDFPNESIIVLKKMIKNPSDQDVKERCDWISEEIRKEL